MKSGVCVSDEARDSLNLYNAMCLWIKRDVI